MSIAAPEALMSGLSVRKAFAVLLAMYVGVLIWVWCGALLRDPGLLPMLGIQVGSLALFSALAWPALSRLRPVKGLAPLVPIAPAFAVLVIAGIVAHWISLGAIPIIDALSTNDYVEAGLIREGVTQSQNPIFNYIPTFVIKVLAPFMAIYLIESNRWKSAIVVMVVATIYAVSLMQKSYPLYVTMPPALFALLAWRPAKAGVCITIGLAAVVVLVLATNPSLRMSPSPVTQGAAAAPSTALPAAAVPSIATTAPSIMDALVVRVFVSPGSVVSQWFDVFPSILPFSGICGYRVFTPLANCAHTENGKNVWLHYNPDLYAQGYRGSMGAAHFMEEYADFGPLGLTLASLLVVLALVAAAAISAHVGFAGVVALNFAFVMALSSAPLNTTLLSGGWALMLVCSLAWTGRSRAFSPVASFQPS